MDQYIGRLLDDRYEILEIIGTGGMAVVYKARDHRLNRLVAVKILKDEFARDEEFRRRFRAEGEAVAMLSHPNIVQVYDVSASDSANYIVMELIDGISLKQYMEKKGVLNWKETLHFAMQIAKRSASRRFVLCEGYMDVISMQQAGIDTAVCACGTALTPEQVRLISEYADEVILSYDSDEAGQKATLRSLELFRNSPVKVGVLQIPGAKDPDEYIKKYGPERFQALLDGVGNALDFRLKRLRDQYDLSQDAQRLQYIKDAVEMLAERSNPTEQEVYAGRLAEETNISKTAILAQLGTAAKRAGGKYRREKNRELLRSGEMDQIKVPYSAGGSQALGIASAQQRLLAAILREPRYLELAKQQLTAEQFIQPQQKELYEAMLNCSREGVELSLTALRAFASEEALNELSRLAAQYSDVNCTPDDIRLYLDRIARGMPVASKAAAMSGDEITQYLQSMREKKQGTLPEQD